MHAHTHTDKQTAAFPQPPIEYKLKDYMLRDVTHRVYDGLADNSTVQVSTKYIYIYIYILHVYIYTYIYIYTLYIYVYIYICQNPGLQRPR